MIKEINRLHATAVGLQKQREKDALARKHTARFRTFFKSQKTRTLEELGKYRFLFTEEYRRMREEVRPNVLLTEHDWNRMWEVIDRETFDELQSLVASAESDGVLAGGNQLRNMVNGKFWDLANPRAVQFFMRTGGSVDYIKGIQTTTSDQLKTIIAHAIDTGQSYNVTAKQISDKFNEFSRDRARRIAVYETGNSYESGNRMYADSLKDDGVSLLKQWNTSHDDRVSDMCQENEDAGLIPLDELFPSGHQQPLAHINCRCYCTYESQ